MGDILIHQCDRVNLNRFWDVMQFDIPELLTSIEPSEQKNYTNILLKRIILEINAFSD